MTDSPEIPKRKAGRPRKHPNWEPQAKLLVAMTYVLHGSARKAALATGVPVRTVNSWINTHPDEWDRLVREAEAQRDGFLASKEKDESFSKISEMIDRIALFGANISLRKLAKTQEKVASTDPSIVDSVTNHEYEMAIRLFGIGTDKMLMIRGFQHGEGKSPQFESFQDKIAQRIATVVAEDESLRKSLIEGKVSKTANKPTVTFKPKPPKAPPQQGG